MSSIYLEALIFLYISICERRLEIPNLPGGEPTGSRGQTIIIPLLLFLYKYERDNLLLLFGEFL